MKRMMLLLSALTVPAGLNAQNSDARRVALVKMPYTGARNVPELSPSPDYLDAGGIADTIRSLGFELKPTSTIRLATQEEPEYGEWHRMGLANGHLAETVSANVRAGYIHVGLLGNCTSLLGTLAGLQRSGPNRRPLKVGLVFIDSHGDFNTPETTLSGMLGGMPVAVAAGMALQNLRMESKLEPALPTRHIVIVGARDLDPLEEDLLLRSEVEMLTVEDVRRRSENLQRQMQRLSESTDVIYVHVDMDVLDPSEVPGHPLTVDDGPTSRELADALTVMFRYEKVAALGIASTPSGERDPDGVSRRAAYNLIRGALQGVRSRTQGTAQR